MKASDLFDNSNAHLIDETPVNLFKFRFNSDMARDIEDVINKYAGKISVAEAVGVLSIMAYDLQRHEIEEA